MTLPRFCPSCGAARIEGARLCGGCGADLAALRGTWCYVGQETTLQIPSGATTLELACNDVVGTYGDNSSMLAITVQGVP